MGKFLLFFKKCPLTAILVGSIIVTTLVSVVSMATGRYNFVWSVDRPFLVTLITGDDSIMEEDPMMSADANNPSGNGNTDTTQPDGGEPGVPEGPSTTDGPAVYPGKMARPIKYIDRDPAPPRSAYYDDPQKTPLTTEYPYVEVDDDYFDDVLFVGDSRIEGLHDYGNLPNATFAYKQGISVFNILETDLKWGDKGHGSLESLLAQYKFKKIYVMLGVNELGKGFAWQFGDKYEALLNQIKEWAPDSVIIVQGIMKVSKSYSDKSDVFNNDNINARNYMITTRMTTDMIYLDMNECVADPDPTADALNSEYTNDGLHLAANYYYLWVDWLKEHGLQDSYFEENTNAPESTIDTGVETDTNQNAE